MRQPAFRRAGPPIFDLVAAWESGPAPALPDGPEDAGTLAALEAELAADASLARQVVREARHPEALVLALGVLARTGDERDAEVLETLARHGALSAAAGEALAGVLGDPVQAWWRVGCVTDGAARAAALHRLEALGDLPEPTRAWLLRHALEGLEPETAALACARAGRLEAELGGLVDDALLDGACAILSGLVRGGDMAAYEPAPRVARVVLDLLARRGLTLARAAAVRDLRGWAEDYEEHVAVAERCARLLA